MLLLVLVSLLLPLQSTADGVSGVEFAGYSNDQTDLADARSDQSGQAIAFPNNLVSPLDPLTCTQVSYWCLVVWLLLCRWYADC